MLNRTRGLVAVSVFLGTTAWITGTPASAQADPEAERPIDIQRVEEATVRLVILDVVVVDGQGRTVPDLTAEDFEIVAAGEPVELGTLDIDCDGSAGAAPRPDTESPGRKIVLVLDYLHLPPLRREDVLDQAKRYVKRGLTGNDEVMVAALTGGLRIEQPFASDHEGVFLSLRRMQYDISLWNNSFSHLNSSGFVGGLEMLFDVLGTVPGPKAVVLFSAMQHVPLDLEFQRLAALASASRCSVYPVDAWGLRTPLEDRQLPGG